MRVMRGTITIGIGGHIPLPDRDLVESFEYINWRPMKLENCSKFEGTRFLQFGEHVGSVLIAQPTGDGITEVGNVGDRSEGVNEFCVPDNEHVKELMLGLCECFTSCGVVFNGERCVGGLRMSVTSRSAEVGHNQDVG